MMGLIFWIVICVANAVLFVMNIATIALSDDFSAQLLGGVMAVVAAICCNHAWKWAKQERDKL